MQTYDLFTVLDATWPAAEHVEVPGWHLRRGAGGGKRVSAATQTVPNSGVELAEAEMRGMDQVPLFMLRPGEEALDLELDSRGYELIDPVTLYSASVQTILDAAKPTAPVMEGSFPLAIMKDLWSENHIGAARLAVMARTQGPHVYLLARKNDLPGGVAFVAAHGNTAMIHAAAVSPDLRRKNLGTALTSAAARWAQSIGADTLALATTHDNSAANQLYQRMGMLPVGTYHYRVMPDPAE